MKLRTAFFLICTLAATCVCWAQELTARHPWLAFDRYEEYRASFYSGTGKLTTLSGGGILLTGNARSMIVRDRKFTVNRYDSPLAARFTYELQAGKPLRMVLAGTADGKPFRSTPAELRPGRGELRVELGVSGLWTVSGIELSNPGGEFELKLYRATLEMRRNPAAALLVHPVYSSRLAILSPKEKAALEVKNPTASMIVFSLDGALVHFHGRELPFQSGEQRLAPGGTFSLPLPAPDRNGHWQIRWKVRSGGDTAVGNAGMARLPELPFCQLKPGDFKFGICAHPGRWAEGERELEARAAARIGAAYVRTSVDWCDLEPVQGRPDYRLFDSVVDLFARHGLETQGMFGFCAQWAAPEATRNSGDWKNWNRAKPDLAAWKTYVGNNVRHFRGRIRIWEIWNEPDLTAFSHFSAADYVDLARVASETARAIDPELTIFSAGFAGLSPHPGRRDPDYQYKVMRDGGKYFDVHAYHGHSNFAAYARQIDERLMPLRKKAGVTIPWYANETAVSAVGGTEREQATALFKKLLFSWSRGAIGYNWYDLRNDGFSPTDPEHHFGLLTHDFQAKPVLSVYHMLARCFRGAKFLRNLALPEGCVGFEFQQGPDRLIALWNEADTAVGPLAVRSDAKRVERIDLMGNAVSPAFAENLLLLEPSREPAVYRFEKASRLEPGAEVILFQSGAVIPGVTFQQKLRLTNPLKQPIDCRLAVLPQKGFSFTPAVQKIRLEPGAEKWITLRGRIDAGIRENRLRMAYELQGAPFSGTLNLPLRMARRIPAGDGNYRRKPDFLLDRPSQVVSLCEGDPSKRHLVWKGVEDLSALLFLRMDEGEKELELYVAVTDDRHVQPETGTNIWMGDSIQFALSIPGQNGLWKIGLARLGDGGPQTFIWEAPAGFSTDMAARAIRLTTHRDAGKHTTAYRAKLRFDSFGLSPEKLRNGIRFNLLVNDNDGELREGFLQIAPGISEWKNFENFPLIVFEWPASHIQEMVTSWNSGRTRPAFSQSFSLNSSGDASKVSTRIPHSCGTVISRNGYF